MNGDAEGIPIQGRLPLELQQIKAEQDAAKAETIKNTLQREELGHLKHIVQATGVKGKEDQNKETEPSDLAVTVPNDERPGNLSIKPQEKNNNGVISIRRSSRKRKIRWFDDGEKWQGSWKRKRSKRLKSSFTTSEPSKTISCHEPQHWRRYNLLKDREENITGKIVAAAVPWKASDDLALISGVQQTQDLAAVHMGVKFSRSYSIKEVEERWHTIMYDPVGSRLARAAIGNLPQEIVYRVLQAVPFSREEELVVGACGVPFSQSLLEPDVIQELLASQAKVFHPSRTAQGLATLWQNMKLYSLLPDQAGIPPTHQHTNFHDMEMKLLEEPMELGKSDNFPTSDRVAGERMRSLETEVAAWQVVVEEVTGQQEVQLGDVQTLAVLKGRQVAYCMRSREMSIGRASQQHIVDVDLALEGVASKVSRRQAVIVLRNHGKFQLVNEGIMPVMVNGKAVMQGELSVLDNNSVVEFSRLGFIFLVNQKLVDEIKAELI